VERERGGGDRKGFMGSSSKRQTTMAKMARERAVQERRELKRQKKEERKQAAAEARSAEAAGSEAPENANDGDAPVA
jgi:hypothetical protein